MTLLAFVCADCSRSFTGQDRAAAICPDCAGDRILVNLGTTVPFKESAKCKLCHKPKPELAVQVGGDIFAYHWRCIKSGEPDSPPDPVPHRGPVEPIHGHQLSLLGDVS